MAFRDLPPALYLGDNEVVSYTGTAATSAAFSEETRYIRVVSDTDCHIKVAKSPTATTSDPLLPAYSVEYFGVSPGQKISAIRVSADGDLHVTEMTR